MIAGFRSLASILEAQPETGPRLPDDTVATPAPVVTDPWSAQSEVRLFYATLREVLDVCVRDCMERIAREVLAREMLLAPADIAAVTERTLRECERLAPVRVRVHPDDASRCNAGTLPVVEDPQLERGDVIVEVRDGAVDARLQMRLRSALEARA